MIVLCASYFCYFNSILYVSWEPLNGSWTRHQTPKIQLDDGPLSARMCVTAFDASLIHSHSPRFGVANGKTCARHRDLQNGDASGPPRGQYRDDGLRSAATATPNEWTLSIEFVSHTRCSTFQTQRRTKTEMICKNVMILLDESQLACAHETQARCLTSNGWDAPS